MKPDIPITDPRFKYVNAANTDLRKTFERVRREQKKDSILNTPYALEIPKTLAPVTELKRKSP